MSLDELEMEVDDVELRVMEMMETDERNEGAFYNQEEKYVYTVVEMNNAASNLEMKYDAPSNNQGKQMNMDVEMVDKATSSYDSPSNQQQELNLESEIESTKQNTTSTVEVKTTSKQSNGNWLYPGQYPDVLFSPNLRQTMSQQDNGGSGGAKKRKSESQVYEFGPNERKRDKRSGPGIYKRSRLF